MHPEIYTVVARIKANRNRMNKLNTLGLRARRYQARCYVIAECQAIRFKANESEIVKMAAMLAG